MLLGRPWLRTTNIKQHWQRNMISLRRGKTKVRIITEECVTTPHNTTSLYAERVHMLDGLADDEVDDFLEDHPTIIPLFEIDAISAVTTPLDEEVMVDTRPQDKPDSTTIAELRHARDAFERELAISQLVKTSTLESLKLAISQRKKLKNHIKQFVVLG